MQYNVGNNNDPVKVPGFVVSVDPVLFYDIFFDGIPVGWREFIFDGVEIALAQRWGQTKLSLELEILIDLGRSVGKHIVRL